VTGVLGYVRAQQDQGGEDLGRQAAAQRRIGGGSGFRHASTIYGRAGWGTLCQEQHREMKQ
jgi:hypothetical protein